MCLYNTKLITSHTTQLCIVLSEVYLEFPLEFPLAFWCILNSQVHVQPNVLKVKLIVDVLYLEPPEVF